MNAVRKTLTLIGIGALIALIFIPIGWLLGGVLFGTDWIR